jgi:hypothetical protein
MRRLWTLLVTPLLALAVFLVGNPAANAFGSEVLGCAWDGGSWIANNCGSGTAEVTFSAHNLSGSSTYSWTLTIGGSTFSNSCAGVTPCIVSGCTATSSSCTVADDEFVHSRVLTASLQLTQAGHSRTITATATFLVDGCLRC